MGYITYTGTQVPVHAYLFSLCARSTKKIWTDKGIMAGNKTNQSLSSLGRTWIRSGSLRNLRCTSIKCKT